MRGIEIKFEDCFDLTKYLAFEKLDLSNYIFWCVDSSAYHRSKTVELERQFTFQQLIELSKTSLVLERFHLQVHPIGEMPISIKTYEEFLSRSCEMIVLVYDGVHLEIYAKFEHWINQLIDNAQQIGKTSISIKTKETDDRKEMYV